MTVKGGTSHACAACKYQRRKCSSDCLLAPYFPPDQPKMFQNAHRLFGVRNILNILKPLNQNQRIEAMKSIIFESDIRARFPVDGCYGVVTQLHYQLQQARMEFEFITTQLAICKQTHHNQNQFSSLSPPSPPPPPPLPELQLNTGNNHPTSSPKNTLTLFQNQSFEDTTGISIQSSNEVHDQDFNVVPAEYLIQKDEIISDHMWMQQNYNTNNNGKKIEGIESQIFGEQPLVFQEEVIEAPQDYDEIPAFFDSREGYESSPESSSLIDTTQPIQNVSEKELKSAASCFSLTSVN